MTTTTTAKPGAVPIPADLAGRLPWAARRADALRLDPAVVERFRAMAAAEGRVQGRERGEAR